MVNLRIFQAGFMLYVDGQKVVKSGAENNNQKPASTSWTVLQVRPSFGGTVANM